MNSDAEDGDDVSSIREEMARSADSYARWMVLLRANFMNESFEIWDKAGKFK